MIQNICHFIPYQSKNDYYAIYTIHFVLETEIQTQKQLKSEALYKMYYVKSGSGFLNTMGKKQPVKCGDIFFTFPSAPFCIESEDDFSYMYISFLGARGNEIMEKLGISKNNCVFHGCNELQCIWDMGISTNSDMLTLVSEGVLLYTFSYIGNKFKVYEKKGKPKNETALKIKKFVDENFSSCDISLKMISENLAYNEKYISSVFKKEFGIGISEYINTVRIEYACALIEQGFKGVSDIAFCCGFKDAQYFSNVFKKLKKCSPSEYIKK